MFKISRKNNQFKYHNVIIDIVLVSILFIFFLFVSIYHLLMLNIGVKAMMAFLIIASLIFLLLLLEFIISRINILNKNKSINSKEEIINQIASNNHEVFYIFNTDKNVMEYVTPNSERILGISVALFFENPTILFNYMEKESVEAFQNRFTEKVDDYLYERECLVFNPIENRNKWLSFRIYPLCDNHKNIRLFTCISDLTEVKQIQQIQKEDLINAQKINLAKKDFLSHISHEIRTPINAIIGITKIASLSLDDTDKIENYLDKIMISSKHLLALVNDILDMSKIENNKLVISKEPFDFKQFINALSSVITIQAELNQQEFELVLIDSIEDYLIGDALRLNQILLNLLSNALKFTPTGGKIKLKIKKLEKHKNAELLSFSVIDNGMGMSEEFIHHIFEPFVQENNSIAKKYGGSGLGMAITENLVSLMKGNIHVISKQNIGTTITVEIMFEIMEGSNTGLTLEEEETHISYDFSDYRVLVVEDNPINLEVTCELLRFTKILVDTAINGSEAFDLFQKSPTGYYDVILMDIRMPDMNGYEATNAIRKATHLNALSIPIIAMTANAFTEDVALSIEVGMNYHVTKPIDIDVFYKLLQNILLGVDK